MSTRLIGISAVVFLSIFVIQESLVSQFRLPGGGFSILIIFALSWAILSEREVAAVMGFTAGLLMDLSQSSSGPFGQWTLIMLLASYGISYLGYGDDNFFGGAIGVVFSIVLANLLLEVMFLISGPLLGVSIGSFSQIFTILFGTSVWTLFITPIVLPLFAKLHKSIFQTGTLA
jgi:rod shape-determining protein MreD